ncbi:MAG: ABC transporter ATP-binding protein [Clostridia bacterium]|nr:ABC transporter ATP-binding protein [Clostridia bacterium]MDD7483241.1 ABC transporter ATP-binding protein [Clostridia bacterium]MDY5558244.1 ABC transporter ATP-binding protein [Candidatus Heritagella sp.]
MALLEIQNLQKTYHTRFGGRAVQALSNVTFSVNEGEYVAVMGESGSGKTTLLNLLATLDRPTSGRILLEGRDLCRLKENESAAFRREKLGFVFQDFNLLDTFSVRDNILLPLVLGNVPVAEMEARLLPLCRRLEIADLLDKFPYEISGGQKQRTAAARALITAPRLLLADEPTGALDSRASDNLLELFREENRRGQTIVMVTHSVKAACHAGRVLFLRDGEILHQMYRGDHTEGEMFRLISDTLTLLTTGGEPHEA